MKKSQRRFLSEFPPCSPVVRCLLEASSDEPRCWKNKDCQISEHFTNLWANSFGTGNSWIFGFPFLDTPKTRSFLITKNFKIYDAVVNENATKQQCHWLREKIIVLHVRTHSNTYSCVTLHSNSWREVTKIWGFDDNASVRMWIFNSLFSLTNRLSQFSFRILRPHCATRREG